MTKPRVRIGTDGIMRGAVVDGKVLSPEARYMNSGSQTMFFNWNVALRDQREDVASGYVEAASKAIDVMHNQGWIAGAVDQSVANMIGDEGLRLAARPDRVALGWDKAKAEAWSDLVERRFWTWANNPMECDARGKMTVSEMQETMVRSHYSHGEGLALLPFIRRAFSSPGTKVQILPPHRLVQDSLPQSRMWQGVTADTFGLPQAYRVRVAPEAFTTKDIRARDGAGRPQVVHIFEGMGARGITPLAPVLRVLRQYDQLSDATLQAAMLQTIFSATIEGDAPTEEILRSLQTEAEQDADDGVGAAVDPSFGEPNLGAYVGAASSWYQGARIDLAGGVGRINHLFPGHKLKFNRSETPNGNYEAFANMLLRETARCLGLTFEDFTGNYSNATYSSVRMATSSIWPVNMRRRRNIPARFSQLLYEAWLEEEIENGLIPFDGGFYGFLANRAAATAADWLGPAKPQADDLKTAKAHEIYKRIGIFSDERIAADLGFDIEDEYERRSREKEKRAGLGLPETDTLAPPVYDPADDAEEPTPAKAPPRVMPVPNKRENT